MDDKIELKSFQNDLFIDAIKKGDEELIAKYISYNWNMPISYKHSINGFELLFKEKKATLNIVKLFIEEMKFDNANSIANVFIDHYLDYQFTYKSSYSDSSNDDYINDNYYERSDIDNYNPYELTNPTDFLNNPIIDYLLDTKIMNNISNDNKIKLINKIAEENDVLVSFIKKGFDINLEEQPLRHRRTTEEKILFRLASSTMYIKPFKTLLYYSNKDSIALFLTDCITTNNLSNSSNLDNKNIFIQFIVDKKPELFNYLNAITNHFLKEYENNIEHQYFKKALDIKKNIIDPILYNKIHNTIPKNKKNINNKTKI